MKKFTYERQGDDVVVTCPLMFSGNNLKIYHKIIGIKGNNGNYEEDLFLIDREEKGIYSRCLCFLETDGLSLRFYPKDSNEWSGEWAMPTLEDIESEYGNYKGQLVNMIKEVIRVQEMIKLIPD